MKIKTKYHGEMTVEKEQIIQFANGLPGFLEEKQFIILPLTDDQMYLILQSIQTPEIAFVITNPFYFYKDYEFKLEDGVVEQLEIKEPGDVQVFNILTIHDPTAARTTSPITLYRIGSAA